MATADTTPTAEQSSVDAREAKAYAENMDLWVSDAEQHKSEYVPVHRTTLANMNGLLRRLAAQVEALTAQVDELTKERDVLLENDAAFDEERAERIKAQGEAKQLARMLDAEIELNAMRLDVLKTTEGNIRSLGPAGALDNIYEPYTVWLHVVQEAIAGRAITATEKEQG